MAGHQNWREFRRHGSPESQARARENVAAMEQRYQATLRGLRQARHLTQVQLAEQMGTSQGEVSRIEREADLHLSTLERFVAATGGRLELRAVYDDQSIPLSFHDLFGDKEQEDDEPQRARVVGVAASTT